MPKATDLIVKNGASSPVDKTFSLVSPAAGDGSLATWYLKEGLTSASFPSFTAAARPTGNKSRQLRLKLHVPSSYTDPSTGLTTVGVACEINTSVSIPDAFPEDKKADVVAYACNLMNHPLVKNMIRDAYSAT